ncbi:hypothetical protein ACMFMG_010575 [Clarireedia jacksonii]
MRLLSFSRGLLPLVACGIAVVNTQSVQTIYSSIIRYKISIVPQYTTITETSYSIINVTGPQVVHTEYVQVTQNRFRTTTVAGGISTVTVTEPANQITIVQSGDVTLSECTATITEAPSGFPLGGTVITETVTYSGVTETVTNAGATETITEGGCSSSLSSQAPSTTEPPMSITISSAESSAEASSSIPPISNTVSGETTSTETIYSSGFLTETLGVSTIADTSTTTEASTVANASTTTEASTAAESLTTEIFSSQVLSTTEPPISATISFAESSAEASSSIPPISNVVSGETTLTETTYSSGFLTETPGLSTIADTSTIADASTTTEASTTAESLTTEVFSSQVPSATEPPISVFISSTESSVEASSAEASSSIPPINNVVSGETTSTEITYSSDFLTETPGVSTIADASTTAEVSTTAESLTTEVLSSQVLSTTEPLISVIISSTESSIEASSTEASSTEASSSIPPTNNVVSGETTSTEISYSSAFPTETLVASTIAEGSTTEIFSSQVPSTTEQPVFSSILPTESSTEVSSSIPPVNNVVSGETTSTELTSSTENTTTEAPGASTTAEESSTEVISASFTHSASFTQILVVSTEEPVATSSGEPVVSTELPVTSTENSVTTSAGLVTTLSGESVISTEVSLTSTLEPIVTSTVEITISSGESATSSEESAISTENPNISTGEPEMTSTKIPEGSTTLIEEPVTSTETLITSTEESLPSSTGIPPANNVVSGETTTTTDISVESSTLIVEPATSTEALGATSTFIGEPATSTQAPVETSTGITELVTSTEAPAGGSASVEEPPTTTEIVPETSTSIGEPSVTTEIVPSSTDVFIAPTTEITDESSTLVGEPATSTGSSVEPTTSIGGPETSTEIVGESTTLINEPPTSISQPSSTEEVVSSTTESPEESTGIPPINNNVSGTTLSTTGVAPEVTSFISEVPPSTTSQERTTSTNLYNFNCPTLPALFSIVVQQEGKPIQYLTQLNYPDHGTTESLWGYDTLPITQSGFQAAHFSIGNNSTLMATHNNGTSMVPITAAVRIGNLGNLGNSPVQMFTGDHIASDMRTYVATVNGQCRIGLDVPPSGANILAACAGVLNVLTPAKKLARGSSCVEVKLYAIEVFPPPTMTGTPTAAISTQVPSTVTASAPLSSFTTANGCTVPPYFKILVNETGMDPQYLYDPIALGDDALSFTSDPDMSLVFYLNPADQLTFNIIDFFGNPVVLASEQDLHNPGNEAVYFSTAAKFREFGYQPVVATVNDDCSIGLSLPYNAANIVMACEGTLWLRLVPSGACTPVSLLMLPYYPPGDSTALPSATPF